MVAMRLEDTELPKKYIKTLTTLAQVLHDTPYIRVTTRHTVRARGGIKLTRDDTAHSVGTWRH